jgi:hypothetical protein
MQLLDWPIRLTRLASFPLTYMTLCNACLAVFMSTQVSRLAGLALDGLCPLLSTYLGCVTLQYCRRPGMRLGYGCTETGRGRNLTLGVDRPHAVLCAPAARGTPRHAPWKGP